jgi:hypothetical protein
MAVGLMQKIKMKTIIIGLITASLSAMAFLTILPIPTWDRLTEGSPDIVIAQCTRTPDPFNMKITNGITIDMRDGLIDSDIEVVSILKGATNLGLARLTSQYWPRQGESYLIFADYHAGVFQAYESYRVVPLGMRFSTNSIAGKPLDEQLQTLFKLRVDNLNQEIQSDEAEKQRLEETLKK